MVVSRLRDWLLPASPVPTATNTPDPRPNERLVFDQVQRILDAQTAQVDSLDTKAGLVAATATALTGGFLVLFTSVGTQAGVAPSQTVSLFYLTLRTRLFLTILFSVAFLTYLLVIGSLYLAVRLRDWRSVGNPTTLVSDYWQRSTDETLANLSATMAAAFEQNRPLLDDKLKWTGRGFIFLGIEVVVLFLATLASVWAGLL